MTKIIKQVTLEHIKALQFSGARKINVAKLMVDLQSDIIVNVSVGHGFAKSQILYEKPDGQSERISLANCIMRLLRASIARQYSVLSVLCPLLSSCRFCFRGDGAYHRNIKSLRTLL